MYNTKGKTQKVYAKNKPNLNLVPKNCVCVFPIELVGGKTLVSNQGIMPNRKYYDKGSFLYWQEVFDGRSALKIQWEGSVELVKPKRPEGTTTGYNYYKVIPHIGKYYYGKPISNGTEQLEISEDASFEDFMSMKASQSVTIRFEYDPTNRESAKWELQKLFRFKLVDNDIYNLYLIPEICENKLMYISDHGEYFDDLTGLSKGCEITFSTLGDKIQKSGQAIEQYCAWNAPGEFAVKPKVVDYYDTTKSQWTKLVVWDYDAFSNPTPIKYLQVEQQGPALTSAIYALGRRQEYITEPYTDPETGETYDIEYWKIGPSKFLLPCGFVTTQPNPLNRTSTPSKNYLCFPDEEVTMVTTENCLKWLMEKATQPLEQVKNNGMISIGDNWDKSGTEVPTENNSNPVIAETGTRKDYYDKTWYPLGYTDAFKGPYDTRGCVYAGDSISFSATDNMIDIFCKNAFIFNQQPIIPLSFYSTRPLFLRDIPLIGTIANWFKLGDIKLSSRTTSRKATSLCYFGDADIMFLCASLNGSFGDRAFKPTSHVFPINFFGTNLSQYQKLGVNSVNTTFCFELTDQVSIDGTTWDTIYLGQSTYEDHTEANPHYLFPTTHQSLLANSTLKPVVPTSSNFIIDAVIVQSIFDGKIKVSCYGPTENDFIYPEWTATILSNANWQNGNMRDWTNVFLLSNWEERFCVQEDEFTWPLRPHKKEDEFYVWNVDARDDFQYEYNTSNNNTWQQADPANFPWPTATVEQIEILKPFYLYIGSSQLDKVIYSDSKSYSDMGITGVTDKDSFLAYFKSATINADDSFLALTGCKNAVVSNSNLTFDFIPGTYTYTNTFNLASIRHYGDKFKKDWEMVIDDTTYEAPARFCPFTEKSSVEGKPWSGTKEVFLGMVGRFHQMISVTVTLGDTAVSVQVKDISKVAQGGYNPSHLTQGGAIRTCMGQQDGLNTKLATEKFEESVRIKTITFKNQ